jgi:anaphase-promoting complex subunit 6
MSSLAILQMIIILDDPNDAFWLAQTYFMTHQYSRAERLLMRPFPTSPPKRLSASPPLTNGHLPHGPSLKGKSREIGNPQLPGMSRLPLGPGGMIEIPEDMQDGVSRLVDMSVACRYLAAQCQVFVIEFVDLPFTYVFRCGKVSGLKP